MRALSGGVFLALSVFGASACGALEGLSPYESVSELADAGRLRPADAHAETTNLPPSGDDTSAPDSSDLDETGADDSSPVVTEAGDDATDDAGEPGANDTGAPADAEMIPDVAIDAPPACGPMTCGGCCQGGMCHGGSSITTCGKGGSACSDCTSEGACSGNGTCTAPVPDAGTKTCNPSQCVVVCIPVYQGACCKSDGTCGCQVVIPSKGTCG
jgi:hypothetical protein